MNLKSILKGVATVAGTLHPGVGAAIGIVNQFLPAAQKLPDTATGGQVTQAYETLPADKKAAVDAQLAHELGMEQEHTAQIQALAEADMSGASTRPHIALVSCWTVTVISIAYLGLLMLDKALPDWSVVAAIVAPFILWVNTYMNARSKEKRTRYAVTHGQSANLSGLTSIIEAFKK